MLSPGRPLRVAVLCSRRAPGLLHLLDCDPHRGTRFDIACVLTSERHCSESEAIAARGVDLLRHPIADYYATRGASLYRDFATRAEYDRETLARIGHYEPDLVLLDGYLFLLTRPMLDAYDNRMLNLHFSDLLIRRPDGRPLYVGPRAVRDALRHGETETCATVHLVTQEPDCGAPVVRSAPYAVSPMVARAREWGAEEMFKACVFAHQEWMLRDAGPLLSAALELVATGSVDLDALATRVSASVTPWLLDARGRLTPPAALHVCERLWGYQRRTA